MDLGMRVQSLMCGSSGTGLSSLITVTSKNLYSQDLVVLSRVVVNAGEGFCRYLADHAIKIAKIDCIILTSLSPHTFAGLPGLLLALSSAGVEKITLIGPMGIAGLHENLVLFVNRRYPEVKVHELSAYCTEDRIELDHLQIDLFPIRAATNPSVVYGVCTLATLRRGSFSSQSAAFLPYCRSFPITPTSTELLHTLKGRGCRHIWGYPLTCMDADASNTANDLLTACETQGFMGVMHYLELSSAVEFRQTQKSVRAYNLLLPRLFPSPLLPDASFKDIEAQSGPVAEGRCIRAANDMVVILPNNGSTTADVVYMIQPSVDALLTSTIQSVPAQVITTEVSETCNYSAADAIRAKLSRKRPLSPAPATHQVLPSDAHAIQVPPPSPSDTRVTFLGTGSASPSKHRSSSAILLQGSVHGKLVSVLLDVGECSVSQMYMHCSGDVTRFMTLLASLDMVWISHHHADHTCGLPMLLQFLNTSVMRGVRAKDKQLFVVTSADVWRYVEYAASVSGLYHLVTFVNVLHTMQGSCLSSELMQLYASKSLVKSMRSVGVRHCRQSYGLVVTLHDCIKIVYSGDCRPSDALTKAGADCDLLIHEATFDDTMAEDAVNKNHCTISEAVHVGMNMRAHHIVLTHFSQRYPTTPTNNAVEGSRPSHVSAVDLLSFYFPSQVIAAANGMAAVVLADREARDAE